jgi:hypothetical protein
VKRGIAPTRIALEPPQAAPAGEDGVPTALAVTVLKGPLTPRGR